MIDLLILWFLNCAVVSCLLFWWFESTLPVLTTLVVRRLFPDKPDDFWKYPEQMEFETMSVWTRQDWNKWRTQTLMPEYPKFAHLLGCSRCISLHMSYVAAITLGAFGTHDWSLCMRCLFLIIAAFGSSTVAHRLIPNATSWSPK